MILLPVLTEPRWSQEQAIAFEAARECLGDMLAICLASIAAEEAKASPDAELMTELETELTALTEKRRGLKLTDIEGLAQVRAFYGAKIRSNREQRQQHAATQIATA